MGVLKRIREISSLAEQEGAEIVEITRRGSHIKLRCRKKGCDEARTFVTSKTPSDVRSMMNLRGEIRRWLAQGPRC